MRVAQLMQSPVQTVNGDASIADAIVTLADGHVSALPVVDTHGRMLGVVSSTDVLTAQAETGSGNRAALLDETPVRNIMTPRGLTIAPDAEVREAAQQMLYADAHRLFVADGERLIGVISTTDIMRAVATGALAAGSRV